MSSNKAINWWIMAYVIVIATVLGITTSCNAHSSTSTTKTADPSSIEFLGATLGGDGSKCMDPSAGRPQQAAATTPELEVSRQGDNSSLFINAGTRPGALVKMHGNGSGVVVVGNVAARSVIFADGNNNCIQIFGSVGDDAVVAISGTSGQIYIDGSVAPTARLCVETGQSYIKVLYGDVVYNNFRSSNPAFWVQAHGTDTPLQPAIVVHSCRDLSSKLAVTTH